MCLDGKTLRIVELSAIALVFLTVYMEDVYGSFNSGSI